MLKKLRRTLFRGGVGLVILTASMPLMAELMFSTPPWASEKEQRAMFDPIAQTMSEWLGTKVVYEYNSNFTTYSIAMRRGKYDVIFDGPQFNSWRASNLNHDILVNVPERLTFMVLAQSSNKSVSSADDLVDKEVCGQAPPHLGTLMLWSHYKNPAKQPTLRAIAGETKVVEDFKSGKCDLAIVRNNVYLGMDDAEKAKYKVVFTSRTVPNLAVSVSPKITKEQRQILISKLTDRKNLMTFKPFFAMKAKAASEFEKADPKEYEGLDLLLKKQSYGW